MFTGFNQVLFLLGYALLIEPPRAIDLQAEEHRTHGELDGKPLIVVLGIELLIRGGILLFIAVLCEEVLGKAFYDLYRLDLVMGVLLLSGIAHSLFYYIFLGCLRERFGEAAIRLYRVGRNLAYALLPGFMTAIPVLIWQAHNQLVPFSGDLVEKTYLVTLALMVFAGLIEAFIVHRKPLGLDQTLRDS
ncbi:MAG: hypothetical protein ACPGF7_00400 [Pontibacterium sp.]